jgi:hypothetical protein
MRGSGPHEMLLQRVADKAVTRYICTADVRVCVRGRALGMSSVSKALAACQRAEVSSAKREPRIRRGALRW